jgi:hypothetical protein
MDGSAEDRRTTSRPDWDMMEQEDKKDAKGDIAQGVAKHVSDLST